MAKIPPFKPSIIEQIAKILGDTNEGFTGSELSDLLHEADVDDLAPNETKWRRLSEALLNKQFSDQCSNNIINFVQIAMEPARSVGNADWHDSTLKKLNKVLSFVGLRISEDGKVRQVTESKTISEAEKRESNLRKTLRDRKIHHDVLKYCRAELLQDNYFHAVFEATKSLADKIREKTGLQGDGTRLVDDAFSGPQFHF